MEIDDNNNNISNDNSSSIENSDVVLESSAYFDLETYISRYDPKSETRLQRLFFIASQTSNDEMARMCLEMAESQLKAMGNTKVYREMYNMMNWQSLTGADVEQLPTNGTTTTTTTSTSVSNSSKNEWYYFFNLPQKLKRLSIHTTSYDSSWVSTTDQAAQFQLETLQSRLLTAQSHLAKEAVRSAYISLANFHKSRGFLKEAFSSILKARDYCTAHLHTAETYLQAVELCFDMKNYGTQLNSFVRKLQQAANGVVGSSTSSDVASILTAKVSVVYALSLLQEGNYSDAANQLVSISIDLTNQFNSVISAEDVVLYSVLLGLATFDRHIVQRVFFPDTSFHSASAVGSASTSASSLQQDNTTNTQPSTLKQRLELVPWVSDAIRYYVRAQYGKLFLLLEQHRIELQLDLRISPHLDTLYHMIRNKCILQYIAPYSSVDFRTMRREFDVNHLVENSQQLEDFVANLITTGCLPHARINLQHGTIVTKKGTPQRDTRRRVELLGDRLLRDVEAILLRMSCFQENILIQTSSQQTISSSSSLWQQRKPSGTAGAGSQVLLHPHLGQVHDMYCDDENDVSSDSNNYADELQDDASISAELQDDVMYVDDGNEAAMMMDISDMIENSQSA